MHRSGLVTCRSSHAKNLFSPPTYLVPGVDSSIHGIALFFGGIVLSLLTHTHDTHTAPSASQREIGLLSGAGRQCKSPKCCIGYVPLLRACAWDYVARFWRNLLHAEMPATAQCQEHPVHAVPTGNT